MAESSFYRRIIAREAGLWAAPIRAALSASAMLYHAGVALRNHRYDRANRSTRIPVPVVSVGNLTVGGTGKTPMVIDIAQRLERMGRSPGVVSRGYKAESGRLGDEELLVRRRCPGAVFVANPDRVAAAERAHRRYGADVVVLDDGFQHRRLARTLDIVLIDATCPFGHGHLLPRGLLREPVTALRRADLLILTRCDQVARDRLDRIEQRLRAITPDRLILRCAHRVVGVDALDGSPLDETWPDRAQIDDASVDHAPAGHAPEGGSLEGRRAVVFAGIAHPDRFAATVASLGVQIVARKWWPDHHRYTERDINTLRASGRHPPCDLFLTTEKDAVKLFSLAGLDPSGIGVVRVAIDFEGDGGTMLDARLRECLHPAG